MGAGLPRMSTCACAKAPAGEALRQPILRALIARVRETNSWSNARWRRLRVEGRRCR
jgi:hypothetical protein